jgi:UDP-N-acetylglucosamine 2-epimerase (non-hydrolysing)
MLEGMETILIKERPKIFIVGGDANCNLAGALAARKLHIKVGHLESGERSFDWRMPEEHNRRIIDHISDYLFSTNEKSKRHLLRESIQGKIFLTGNTIVDAAFQNRVIAEGKTNILSQLALKDKSYILLTIHREENVDNRRKITDVFSALEKITSSIGKDIIFSIHPRTLDRIKRFNLLDKMKRNKRVKTIQAVGYLDFLKLLSSSLLVLTDSGGVQQESYILRVPCVTLRESTEWVETVKHGGNYLAGTNPANIAKGAKIMLKRKIQWKNLFGNGNSSAKIVRILKRELGRRE